MKKIISLVTATIIFVLSLTACGGSKEKSVSTDGSTSMEKVISALGSHFREKIAA